MNHAVAFLAAFWVPSLWMMTAAINMGRRRATLTAGNSGLTVVQTGPFGVKRREYRRGEIAAIRADASHVTVNDLPVIELQIQNARQEGGGLQFSLDFAHWSEMESPTQESPAIPPEWLEEFEAAARRPLETRLRYAFIHTYKPVLDDAPFRAFASMEEYRRWCETNLPDWLGYGRV